MAKVTITIIDGDEEYGKAVRDSIHCGGKHDLGPESAYAAIRIKMESDPTLPEDDSDASPAQSIGGEVMTFLEFRFALLSAMHPGLAACVREGDPGFTPSLAKAANRMDEEDARKGASWRN